MNKLTATLIIALMSCALCSCMSEQEWKEWSQKRDQEHIEWLFSMRGVEYPGTREEYIAAHQLCTKEDLMAFTEAFCSANGEVVIGSLDMDDYREKIDNDFGAPYYLLEEQFEVEWRGVTSEEREKIRRLFGEFMNTTISHEGFVRGMTLEQLRVSLQVPLEVEYVSPGYAMYSGRCESPNYVDDCSIHFTFINDRLSDWTKHYSRRIRSYGW